MIKATIIDYINHIEEQEFFDRLFLQNDHDAIAQAILKLLSDDSKEIVGSTLLFIRDSILLPKKQNIAAIAKDTIFSTAIIIRIEALTQDPYFLTRHQAVYTLGKIGSTGSIPLLHHVLQIRRDSDPLLLPHLVGEIFWLEDTKSWHLLTSLAQSSTYPTRWSVLGVLSFYSGDNDFQLAKRNVLELLRHDTNNHVRNEAEYLWQEFLLEQKLSTLTRPEKRALRKHLEKSRPAITFSDIEIWFLNKYNHDQAVDYTVEQLIQFIEVEAPDAVKKREEYQRSHRNPSK